MRRKNLIYMVVILVGIFHLIEYPFAAEAKKEGLKKLHKTIIIYEEEGLVPPNLTAKPGITVSWVNLSETEAEILFLDKEVTDAADCPVYFFIGRKGAYESHKMCAGCTASLCFREKGRFDYIVKESRTFHGGEKEFRGTIVIK